MDYLDIDLDNAPVDFVQLALHCEALREGRVMPRQADFHYTDVTWLHGRLFVADVLNGGRDFRFLKFGLFWQAIFGGDCSGRRLSEIETDCGAAGEMQDAFLRLLAIREPVMSTVTLMWPDGVTIVYDRIMMPLSDDGSSVSRIVVAAHCDDLEEELVRRDTHLPLPKPAAEVPLALAS